MNETQKTTLVHAINHFGVECQTEKALEEMGELITELSRRHSSRGDKEKIAEEVADALVVLEQLRIIYGGERVDGYVAQKLARLEKNMNGDWKRQEKMMPPGMVVHRSKGEYIPANDVRERTGKYSTVTCVEQCLYGGTESEAKKAAEIAKLWTEGLAAGLNAFDPETVERVKTATEIVTDGKYAELYEHMKRLQPRRVCLYCKYLGVTPVEGFCDAVCNKNGEPIIGRVSEMGCGNFEPYLDGGPERE